MGSSFQSLRRGVRPLAPEFICDVYDLWWRTHRLQVSWLDRVKFVSMSLLNRVSGFPELVTLKFEGDTNKYWLRPFTTDLRVLLSIVRPPGEYDKVFDRVHTAKTIVDLGANVGMSVRLWARQYPGALIVALEPDPGNFVVAKKNVAAVQNVVLRNNAINDRSGILYLSVAGDAWGFTTSDKPLGNAIEVEATTMSEVLRDSKVSSVDLLKVDIEGAESALFKDCGSWIHQINALVVETHNPYSLAELQKDLVAAGSGLSLTIKIRDSSENAVGFFELGNSVSVNGEYEV